MTFYQNIFSLKKKSTTKNTHQKQENIKEKHGKTIMNTRECLCPPLSLSSNIYRCVLQDLCGWKVTGWWWWLVVSVSQSGLCGVTVNTSCSIPVSCSSELSASSMKTQTGQLEIWRLERKLNPNCWERRSITKHLKVTESQYFIRFKTEQKLIVG